MTNEPERDAFPWPNDDHGRAVDPDPDAARISRRASEARRCVLCGRACEPGSFFPFCSARCRAVDLGNWVNEAYKVEGADATLRTEEEDAGEDEEADG